MTAALDRQIIELQKQAFPGAAVFAVQRWWLARPAAEDLWFTADRDGSLIASVRLLHRRIATQAGELMVAGIANVCSSPAARGAGAAKACMLAAQDYIARAGKADFGLLFCRQPVRDFYARLGWFDVDNAVAMTGEGGGRLWLADRHTMIYPGRQQASRWPGGQIDLNGTRW